MAIGIAAVVVFVLAMVTLFTRKQINLRRAKRYLREERVIIAGMKASLQKVQQDLEAPPEQRDLLADHMEAVRRLVARIRVTSGINVCARRVADDISNHMFRPDEPEASHDTVITALIDCDKAEYGYNVIDERLQSATSRRQRVPRSKRS